MSILQVYNENNQGKVYTFSKHRKNLHLNDQENKHPFSHNTDIEVDDLFSMLKEDLILRNKVDLKISKACHFVIGRRRPRVLVEYVDDFEIDKSKQKPMKIALFTTSQ